MPTPNDDVLYWNPADGYLTIDGLGDNFDTNYYANQNRDSGFTYGDLLRLSGDGLTVYMTGWNSGYAYDPPGSSATGVNFTGIEQVFGTSGNDVFRAGGVTSGTPWYEGIRGVSLFGGAGNDDFVGSQFDDFFDPGDDDDIVRAGDGNDHVDASRGNDTVYGGAGSDNIRWGGGDSSWLAPGDDVLRGGSGYDVVNLWAYYGSTEGSPGTSVDISVVRADGAMTGTGTVQIDAAANTDTAQFSGFELGWTHQGNDTIDASGADIKGDLGIVWSARWGDDVLIGSEGDDTLEGGPGSDTITGGAGDDLIAAASSYYDLNAPGDGDSDTIIFYAGDGQDTVTGFDEGVDILDFNGRSYDVTETGTGTLIDLDGGDTVFLVGVFDFE